jgi:hypothetical protein
MLGTVKQYELSLISKNKKRKSVSSPAQYIFQTELIAVTQSAVEIRNQPSNMGGVVALSKIKRLTKLCPFEGHVISKGEFENGKK